jgi:hypothetical protein
MDVELRYEISCFLKIIKIYNQQFIPSVNNLINTLKRHVFNTFCIFFLSICKVCFTFDKSI